MLGDATHVLQTLTEWCRRHTLKNCPPWNKQKHWNIV